MNFKYVNLMVRMSGRLFSCLFLHKTFEGNRSEWQAPDRFNTEPRGDSSAKTHTSTIRRGSLFRGGVLFWGSHLSHMYSGGLCFANHPKGSGSSNGNGTSTSSAGKTDDGASVGATADTEAADEAGTYTHIYTHTNTGLIL